MDQKYENITKNQISMMKHALGLGNSKSKPKYGKYTAYRKFELCFNKGFKMGQEKEVN